MATDDDSDVPDTGAVFTFGKSKFADNAPSKFWIREDKVLHIACGDEHTALVAESGRVFTFGDNSWGQLGLGHTKVITKPTRIKSLKSEKVLQIACGRSHTILATQSGKLYSFGCNNDRQLGLGSSEEKIITPTAIENFDAHPVKMISAGMYHSAVLSEKGSVYIWGTGEEGQLGLGEDVTKQETPEHLEVDEEVVCIACGYYHTALVTASGKLLTFGEPDEGKLGLGNDSGDHFRPKEVEGIEGKVTWVACGGAHTVAVTDSGKAYTFGNGSSGQLGHGNVILQADTPHEITWPKPTRVTFAACGENHTTLITDRGQLWTCGDGRHGKLALGEENFANQFKPSLSARFSKFTVEKVSCGGCHTLATARPGFQNGHISSEGEEEVSDIENGDVKKDGAVVQAVIHRGDITGSYDLSGSISARNRRREKLHVPEAGGTLTRTLPPLNSSIGPGSNGKSLVPLGAPLASSSNPLDHSLLPLIRKEEEAEGQSKPKEESESEEEASSDDDDDEDLSKKRSAMKKQSAAVAESAAPLPKPRGAPKSDQDSEGSEKDGEEEKGSEKEVDKFEAVEDRSAQEEQPADSESNHKPVPASRNLPSHSPSKSKEESEEEGKSEEERVKSSKVEDDSEDDQSDEDKKSKKKKKEEKKKKDKEKDKRKRGGGLFGKKKVIDSDEESEEESEDEEEDSEEDTKKKKKKGKDKKKDKKKTKKKGKSMREESEEEDEEDEESDEEKKDTKKDKKSKKDEKSKSKKKEDPKKNKKNKSKDEEESVEEEDKDENAKEDNKEDKEDEVKPSSSKGAEPEAKKKSRTCTIL